MGCQSNNQHTDRGSFGSAVMHSDDAILDLDALVIFLAATIIVTASYVFRDVEAIIPDAIDAANPVFAYAFVIARLPGLKMIAQ